MEFGRGRRRSGTTYTSRPPVITSANQATFEALGSTASFSVTTSGSEEPLLSESGALPSGVTFKSPGDGTAMLIGSPASGTVGTYPITLTASNGIFPDATQSFTLSVTGAGTSASATVAPSSVTHGAKVDLQGLNHLAVWNAVRARGLQRRIHDIVYGYPHVGHRLVRLDQGSNGI